ncbi:MAG: GAF sensor signal transduction histidine kinase [Dehalococcoidia bacterium]|nr:GAF sensor signal transduction histidine kinase [Dehalococcoidia bacterium]MBF8303777.1 sensor signal transduction histidine kinase [Dehalococcoidia bacterium]
MSLQRKASLYSGLGILALLCILAFLGVRSVVETSQRTFQERVIMAQVVAQEVDRALGKARTDLHEFATLESIDVEDSNPLPERQALESLYRYSRSFTFLFLLDRQGNVLYSKPERPELVGIPFLGYGAIANTVEIGTPFLSSTLTLGESRRPVFVMAVPVSNKQGKTVGAVGGWLTLSDIIGNLIPTLQMGETAFVEIVSQEGLIMATTKEPGRTAGREETEYAAHFATLIKENKADQETCYRCHETATGMKRTKDVLAFAPLTVAPGTGGVAIRQSLSEALAPVRRLEYEIITAGSLFFIIGLSLTWLGVRSLVRPLSHLTSVSRKIAEGDLGTEVVATSRDEIGTLAKAFEAMRLRLKETLHEKEERVKESEARAQQLSALNSVAASVSHSLDLDQVLGDSLNTTLQILKLDEGGVFLRESSGELSLRLSRGTLHPSMEALARLQPETSHPVILSPFLVPSEMQGDESRSYVHIPLASKGKLLGSMVLVSQKQREFTPLEMELMTAIGHQIGTGLENAQLFQESQRRQKEAEALFRIGLEVSRLLNLDSILDSVVEKAHKLLDVDAAILSLQEEDSHEISIKANSGPIKPTFKGMKLKEGEGLAGRVISLGKPVITGDYLSDPVFKHSQDGDNLVRESVLKSHLGVPLMIGEKVFGSLSVATQKHRYFSEQEIAVLQQLAQLAALAIENARLYGQVQELATHQERERLAREMHDGLGQVLGYLQLRARGVEDMLAEGKITEAQKEMQEMRKVVREAYEDVRQGILALRSKAAPEAGLVSILEDYFEGFRQQTGIPLKVEVKDVRATHLPSDAAVQIVRVIQEALANVRKHARAKKAKVSFQLQGQDAVITIEDDGAGFDPSRITGDDRQHFGIQTMKERCRSVGAQFNIDSRFSKGTTVMIRMQLKGGV